MGKQKCVWDGCPFEEWVENLCEYHGLLIDYWFYELDGVQYCPAELTFTLTGEPAEATYPETADPDKETYRARYQAWARGLGPDECDRIVVSQGGKPWKAYFEVTP